MFTQQEGRIAKAVFILGPVGRDVEPEPPELAFFDPTGVGAVKLLRLRSRSQLWLRSKLKKSFFNCREYLFGK